MTAIITQPMIEIARYAGKMSSRLWTFCFVAAIGSLSATSSSAAELSLGNVHIRPNTEGRIIVSGSIDDETTFGLTIRIELVPRPGSVGTVEFTPVEAGVSGRRGTISIHHKTDSSDEVRVSSATASDMDVVQVGDPWPNQGTFSPFDTDRSGSPTLNGVVDDNGTFIPTAVVFSGVLSAHPFRAGAGASGVWDVTLSTSHGRSGWEAVSTVLSDAIIVVTPKACVSRGDCDDGNDCTLDVCDAGVCRHNRSDNSCSDGTPVRKRRGSRRP